MRSGARIEHLSRTNTTRMNGTEVADSAPVSLGEPAEVVLAGDLKLRLKPVPSAVLSPKSARTILGGGSGLRGITRPDGSSVGGYVIEAVEPAGAGPCTLWLFGAVRARDVLPRLGDDSLILASVPHLVRGAVIDRRRQRYSLAACWRTTRWLAGCWIERAFHLPRASTPYCDEDETDHCEPGPPS